MKFVLANWGTRGEVEPYVAVGRELIRRGHDVHMAVTPEMVAFAEAAGPTAVRYGPPMAGVLDPHRDFWLGLFDKPWTRTGELGRLSREYSEPLTESRGEVSATLTSLASGADLLLTGMNFEDVAVNVADYCGIPFATLHHFPLRANGRLLPVLPPPVGRSVMSAFEWLAWRGPKKSEDAQRRELGLPVATSPWPRRIAERGSLEIQAYDEVCFPGLASEWAKWNGQRPFVGALTMALPTDNDDDVTSWIAAGEPPICFAFGSVGVESAADTLAMITGACAQLGQRALICAAGSDFTNIGESDGVKVVDVVNYAAIFPACRALVHHGGSGTTNAGMRAGIPTLILWTLPDQAAWAARVKRLKVGAGRRFSMTVQESLVEDLRTILAPDYLSRARGLGAQMTTAAESIAAAADLVEQFAGRGTV
ncbi:glycosyltransferase [Mycolicibacterium sarraceniae]|uniref:Glycosyltransferase n=1 Tax=Mycolicibacterium sarraceniae TaxID=1534348 RepID=A0A7I7SS33_9MYCO|nr:glycosyltransferase [Mycolicibacterium sarraceniae]BBY59812.1 glycosyltransferase [Mycolicibacterium sarraceniae]